MKFRRKIKIATLLALILTLTLTVTAIGGFEADFTSESLDDTIARYMDERGLDETNFTMGWCDLTTGEQWFFNENKFMGAGSMYKLPLNMVYTDKLASGDIQPDDFVGVYTVARAMELSIVYSDNDAADALHEGLSSHLQDYRLILSQYSGLDESELPEEYFTKNHISARFMINTLVYLYDNSELYSQLLEYMKLAHPGRFFKLSEGEYEIAHKYGFFEGCLDDCAIVYTPRPFALVVFTQNVRSSEEVLSELCALMTDYSLYLDSLPEPEPEILSETQPRESVPPDSEPAPTLGPEPEAASESTAPPAAGDARIVGSSAPFWCVYIIICGFLLFLATFRKSRRKSKKGVHRH